MILFAGVGYLCNKGKLEDFKPLQCEFWDLCTEVGYLCNNGKLEDFKPLQCGFGDLSTEVGYLCNYNMTFF